MGIKIKVFVRTFLKILNILVHILSSSKLESKIEPVIGENRFAILKKICLNKLYQFRSIIISELNTDIKLHLRQ